MGATTTPAGYSYNTSSTDTGAATSLPSNLYPQNDNGAPTNSNTAAVSSPYGVVSGAPTLSSTVANTGSPGSGTSGNGAQAGKLGYESLIPFANTAAYYGTAEATQGATLSAAADQNLNAYTNLLTEGISSDPTVRMAQAAPGITAQEQQTQSALQNIASLPRGGAQDYLAGQAYISEASNVSDLINQAYIGAREIYDRIKRQVAEQASQPAQEEHARNRSPSPPGLFENHGEEQSDSPGLFNLSDLLESEEA